MMVFLNGAFVPAEEAKVSVFDRSFLYGDGLFETLRVIQGRPFRLDAHLARLARAAEFAGVRLPFSRAELVAQVQELVRLNGAGEWMLRISISRGEGGAGYSPQGANSPVVVMALRPAPAVDCMFPAQWRLVTASFRLAAGDRVSQVKSCSQLLRVLARAEAEKQGADEALLLDTNGSVCETASASVMWLQGGTLFSPPPDSAALPGITREVVRQLCPSLNLGWSEAPVPAAQLARTDGVFAALSSLGIVEVVSLDGCPLQRSDRAIQLHRTYQELLTRETAAADARA